MKICEQCGKEFEPKFKFNENKFCSLKCYWNSKRGKPSAYPEGLEKGRGWNKGITGEASHSFGNKHTLGKEAWNKGEKTPDGVKAKQSEGHRKNPTRFWLGKKRPDISELKQGTPREDIRGEKNWKWKGGKSRDYKSHYNSLEYREWRRQIFERDNFTCQRCGANQCYIEPHHIKSWSEYPELRYEVSNGTTLCLDCHAEVDPFRKRLKKK